MQNSRMKKRMAFLLAAALFLGLITGCAGDTSNASSAQPNSSQDGADQQNGGEPEELSGEIVIWSWDEGEVEAMNQNFQTAYPGVTLKYVPVDNGNVTVKLQIAAASDGEFPDIAYQEISTRGRIFAMNIWEDLSADPYNFDESLVWEPMLNLMKTEDGRILGIDREYNPSGFVYRRSLALEYLGTDDPEEVYALISDWEKFVEAGTKVKEQSGGSVYMLAGLDDINWMLSGQYDEVVFDGNTAKLTDYYTHVLTPMIAIRDAGIAGVMKRWTPAWNASYNDANVLIYEYAPWSGTAAIKSNAPDAAGDWTVIEATGGPYTMGGTAYGIPTKAENKELAWEFIKWTLLTPEGTRATVNSLGVIAPLKDFYNPIPEYNDDYFNGQDVNKFLLETIAPKMTLRPVHEYDSILNDVMSMMIDIIQDDASIGLEQAIQMAIEETKNSLPADMEIV